MTTNIETFQNTTSLLGTGYDDVAPSDGSGDGSSDNVPGWLRYSNVQEGNGGGAGDDSDGWGNGWGAGCGGPTGNGWGGGETDRMGDGCGIGE